MKSIRQFTILIALVSVGSLLSAQETDIPRRDVPPPVLAAFDKAYPHAKVLEWEREIHNGKVYYEAETVDGKIPRNVLYFPDGTVAQIEEKMAVNEVPPVVAQAAKNGFPKSTIRSAHKVTQGDTVEYALELKGVKQKEIVIRADGTIASNEGKTAIDRSK